jgi:hypothetical protein
MSSDFVRYSPEVETIDPDIDLVLKNNPVFVANTAKHYLVLQEVGNDSVKYLARGKTGFRDLLTGRGTFEQSDWAWEEMFAFVKAAQIPVRNPVTSTYWTMGVVRHGDYIAKLRVAPVADSAAHVIHRELDLRSGPDSCARTSTRCRSMTQWSNGRRSCPPSSRSDGCIYRARTSRNQRTPRRLTRSRSTSGA